MASTAVEKVLSLVTAVTPSGNGWSGHCPAHDDGRSSLSVSEGKDGRVLLKCHAGCSTEDVVQALGLHMKDLFPVERNASRPKRGIAIETLANDKRLPVQFLNNLGLRESNGRVLIPYRLTDGSPAPRTRVRTALRANDGSFWMPRRGPSPVPYGLDRLEEARKQGYVVLVEGESDCWTLWFHEYPAMGIPGASMTKVLQAEHVDGVPLILIQQEPGSGGEAFVSGAIKRLGKVGWRGRAAVIHPEGAKDFNELHKLNSAGFKTIFEKMLEEAQNLPAEQVPDTAESEVGDLLVNQILGPLPLNPPSSRLDRAMRELAVRLAGADSVRRGVAREAAIRHLRGLGIGAPAKLVDAAIGVSQSDHGTTTGKDLTSPEPEAWPEAVDGAELLEELVGILKKYLVLPLYAAEMLALWIIHVHALDAWWVSPILVILSPTKRCGKSTLLIMLTKLVPRALPTSNITPAALFRSVDRDAASLLIDEADSFLSRSDELRGVVNSGHCRDTAYVLRCVGDDHEPRRFRTWGGKAIAAIGRIPSTLEDRGIVLPMRRKAPGEKVTRLRLDRLAHLEIPRRKAMRWVEDHLDKLRDADPELPNQLHDRAQDNWRPLVAIADTIGGVWPELARTAALAFSTGSEEGETTPAILLLSDLRELFLSIIEHQVSTEAILRHLNDRDDRPWREWKQSKPLSGIQLARQLRPFGVRPRSIRVGSGTMKGYVVSDFDKTFSSYLTPLSEPSHPQQVNDFKELHEESTRNTDDPVPGREHDVTPDEERDVTGVTGQNRGSSEKPELVTPEGVEWEEFEV